MTNTILHVGQMKSSTTFVQGILSRNRERLNDLGFYYPGNFLNHQGAVYGLCGSSIPWMKDNARYKVQAKELIEEVSSAKKKGFSVIISSEALSSSDKAGIENFLSAIGGADKSIFSIRSFFKTLPSAWQQTLKTGSNVSIGTFFEQMSSTWPTRSDRWKTYSYGKCSENWANYLDVEAFIIPNKINQLDESWQLFCQTVGIPRPDTFVLPKKESNTSFSIETSEILRALSVVSNEEKLNFSEVVAFYFKYFVNGSEKVGRSIYPPIEYRHDLEKWSEEETGYLKKYANNIQGDLNSLVNYDGKWGSIKDCTQQIEIDPIIRQFVMHLLNYYSKSIIDK